MNDHIDSSELQSLVERINGDHVNTSATDCLRYVLENIADDIESSNLSDICNALAALGRRWRGYPDAPLVCDVLAYRDGSCKVIWALADEVSILEMMPCTLGDLLDACTSSVIPSWFPVDWMKVYDVRRMVWRPRRKVSQQLS